MTEQTRTVVTEAIVRALQRDGWASPNVWNLYEEQKIGEDSVWDATVALAPTGPVCLVRFVRKMPQAGEEAS